MSDHTWEFSTLAQTIRSPAADFYYSLNIPAEVKLRLISVTHSDPTGLVGYETPGAVHEAVSRAIDLPQKYDNPIGTIPVREKLAARFSYPGHALGTQHIAIQKGNIGAIYMMLTCLLDEGDNAVLPAPCYHVYGSILQAMQAEARHYRLDASRDWAVDMESFEAAINEKTKLVVVSNPNNPCGSVIPRDQLLQIVEICARKRVLILSDEVYNKQVFDGEFTSMGEVAGDHPVIVLDSLDFKVMAPGWRFAWLVIYDKLNRTEELRSKIFEVSLLYTNPSTFLMYSISDVLTSLTPAYFEAINTRLKASAALIASLADDIPTISFPRPKGSFVSLVNVDLQALHLESSVEFCRRFAEEEGVIVFPAEVFGGRGGFRLTLFQSAEVLTEIFVRLRRLVTRVIDSSS
jgi:tyrosine aminotransferase